MERLVNEAGARQQVDHRNQALTEAATAVTNAEEQCVALREKYERNLQIRNQHAQLDNQLQSLDLTEKQLLEGQRLVIEWEASEERLKENRNESDLLEEVLTHLGAELAEKRAAQEACKVAEDAARAHYQALSASADAIRQAVASIAEHLPSEQESCPLCLYPHGATELHERVSALTTDAPVVRTLEELTAQKNLLDDRILELNGQVDTVQSALDAQQRQLQELSSAVRTTEETMRHAQAQLASLRASWQRLGLEGDPLAEAAQARASILRSTLADLESNLGLLENLGVEISAWAKLNESQLAQRLIDALRLDRSEESFFAYLNDRIAIAAGQLADLTKLSDAMDTLDAFLRKEIENVQKHVSKVVPRWQALLKRVVRETRFHEASLNFFSHYNRERAEVLVPLGNKTAPVPDVASEAQLTDLQLTFLLSMAMSHQWSPWKALLLDDPTQHHDLVHASAVFDLLRDYIVDHGFQVVIATHGALQARYFLRKLQNDGIEAKIWSLVPTDNGVTAEEGQRKQRGNLAPPSVT